MSKIGKINKLKVKRRVEFGVYLELDSAEQRSGDQGKSSLGMDNLGAHTFAPTEVLLPRRFVPESIQIGDELEVFICFDSEDRLIATTEVPFATVGECAQLEVRSVEDVGAFLDWGLSKDLFLPFSEQTRGLKPGQEIIVFIYLDKSGRISASMRIDRNLKNPIDDLEEGQSVQLLIYGKTDLGFKAIINKSHVGVLYYDEVFQPLQYGQSIMGFIKKIRADKKIDLSLQRTGHKAGDDIAPRILELLQDNNGFLKINDKTSPEEIYKLFGASKKKFKIALGGLYKKRAIKVTDEGIELVKANKQ